jgi:hypothetical protein
VNGMARSLLAILMFARSARGRSGATCHTFALDLVGAELVAA